MTVTACVCCRFGFVCSGVRVERGRQLQPGGQEEYHQYVHCTGGMFIIIEDTSAATAPAPSRPLHDHKPATSTLTNKLNSIAGSAGSSPVSGTKPVSSVASPGPFSPGKENKNSNSSTFSKRNSNSFGKKSSAEMRKDYIARQTSQTIDAHRYEREVEIGFLWSWNFMSSKRWRSANTGDETFQDNVLRDFRAFCSNEENRLSDFWHKYCSENLV